MSVESLNVPVEQIDVSTGSVGTPLSNLWRIDSNVWSVHGSSPFSRLHCSTR